MERLFREYPEAVRRTEDIVEHCGFSLGELAYEYPDEPIPRGLTPDEHLANLTWQGAAVRYPDGIPPHVRDAIEKELRIIAQLNYARYFLTVHDIVRYAVSRGILCQGRGSAANSAVCYCLHITAVDPAQINLLFERFISTERREPPDIDVDFEHERREEVIQYIYRALWPRARRHCSDGNSLPTEAGDPRGGQGDGAVGGRHGRAVIAVMACGGRIVVG